MANITQRLPLELLAEILGYVPVRDVLRFEQVSRVFRDAILGSLLIKHKRDLFAAGFEHNAAAGICLADSQKALDRYLSSLDELCPIQKDGVNGLRPGQTAYSWMAGGVYGTMDEDSVHLTTLESASRGIPQTEWTIPRPSANPLSYSFYPVADVIAFAEASERWIRIHLRNLSNGEHHPTAQSPTITIHYPQPQPCGDVPSPSPPFVSITSFRLAAVIWKEVGRSYLVVWDWKNAQVLLQLDNQPYQRAEFIDDYRLLVCIDSTPDTPPSIRIIDTGKFVGGAPVQTTFQLSAHFGQFQCGPELLLERGVHKPSPEELRAPFYQDPTQRIVALAVLGSLLHPVFRVQALLGLLEDREGSEVGWDEWKGSVIVPSIDPNLYNGFKTWVSGCRLFFLHSLNSDSGARMKLFDFSIQGRVRYLNERVDEDLEGVKHLSTTQAEGQFPWHVNELLGGPRSGGHDSFVFCLLSELPDDSDGTWNWYIWTF